jgi:hypothetical protein
MTPDEMRKEAMDCLALRSGGSAERRLLGLQAAEWQMTAELCERLDKLAERPPAIVDGADHKLLRITYASPADPTIPKQEQSDDT